MAICVKNNVYMLAGKLRISIKVLDKDKYWTRNVLGNVPT
jgi:hypothetical protein